MSKPSPFAKEFSKPLEYHEVDAIVRAKRKGEAGEVVIVDVRDPDEREEEGFIPFSINIPSPHIMDLLRLSATAFQKKYNIKKPALSDPILLYCRDQRRSALSSVLLEKKGFKLVTIYMGGHEDWLKKEDPYADDL